MTTLTPPPYAAALAAVAAVGCVSIVAGLRVTSSSPSSPSSHGTPGMSSSASSMSSSSSSSRARCGIIASGRPIIAMHALYSSLSKSSFNSSGGSVSSSCDAWRPSIFEGEKKKNEFLWFFFHSFLPLGSFWSKINFISPTSY
nr:hypothetical protein [Cressdnaviricota sp.]UOF81749.1 hypothetical protein [Cressdnaviricota sp.]UOF82482.1 hypothetical protein [Cressdnaviricota sp.]UOF82950.1 hypothetical protein [Cressdnaviricota sp.]UOF82972.1 hypothetical protein [Cressdnaviricota sp.]